MIASLYQQTPLIPTPQIPRYFINRNRDNQESAVYDVTPEDLLNAQCDVAELYARILTYRSKVTGQPGDEADAKNRTQLYLDLTQLRDNIHALAPCAPALQRLHVILLCVTLLN